MVRRPMGKIAVGYENVIVYRGEYVQFYFYHNKPLYEESTTNGFLIQRTFINDGSSINLMPLSTLKVINIDVKSLRRSMTISSFDNKDILTLGQDRAKDGETTIARPIGVPLPKWEKIFEKKDESSGKKNKRQGGKIRYGNTPRNEVETEVKQNTRLTSYACKDEKIVYYL
ncbi:hypothetical protein Goari_003024 [Gossypium aridum]|uniref:Uncharacterized protein n=1 Tax=Gossypium aridum TaxID=34290 RepID=A0A7J8YA55_GOSAI|nr:hypothetical protein [Gossypium aridum]